MSPLSFDAPKPHTVNLLPTYCGGGSVASAKVAYPMDSEILPFRYI